MTRSHRCWLCFHAIALRRRALDVAKATFPFARLASSVQLPWISLHPIPMSRQAWVELEEGRRARETGFPAGSTLGNVLPAAEESGVTVLAVQVASGPGWRAASPSRSSAWSRPRRSA